MPRTEIVDRSPVEILLDDRRADVGGARDGRRIAEALAHLPHYSRDHPLRLRLALGDSVLGEADRGGERAAPGAEVLRRDLLAHVVADVLVQDGAGERAEVAVPAIPEQPRSARQGEQLL